MLCRRLPEQVQFPVHNSGSEESEEDVAAIDHRELVLRTRSHCPTQDFIN